MWNFGIILLGTQILIISRSSYASVVQDEIYTENGRPMVYPTDEEIADQLNSIGDEQENYGGQESQYDQGGDVDSQNGKRELEQQQQEPAPIRKREGQEEYATFVEPHQNRQLIQEKQIFHGNNYDKRARMDEASKKSGDVGDTIFIAVTTVCTAAAVFGLMGAAYIWHRVHNRQKAAQDSEYPHYGVTGPSKERSGSNSPVAAMDAKLASSAQLYHYQHTKQQIIAMEQSTHEGKGHDSDDSEGEEDEGDFSVYEYPGLAPTGDIEVTNPLFENVASPLTKTDPKLSQIQPRIHQSKGDF